MRWESVVILTLLNFDFSDLDYEMDTCFLHSMLHFTFALKKDYQNLDLIWFNKIFLSKIVVFFAGN